ncbi:Oidioi.mRNA.OKI2018_I69.chr2.g4791.t1.cds [Oikopleura dioica]|uniref:Oidioi.mRNA.OKI2018_I69.chr2.g4790.t1.cds n=1 Tax=Oikopleura dioica TaxID=34765 RepID=A0ABN7SY16_OIKDI|nr:Oidioi.mRNA.OKI2018_I69.chr2.g4790.t1.cds [Oikopleura dioica]CAG5110382.1 Oidioi.mRNA.OKI2018_I69.chr2.g4791.t1.cds [Oikopleura dioica]
MKFSTTAALIAATNASGADISGHLVAADTHFWTNAASITDSADSILNSWNGKYDKAMDDAFHMCTSNDYVTADDIWECGKKVTAATFDKNPSFNLMGRYGASQFNKLDKNHDGKLCFSEFKRGFAGFFSTIGSTLVDIFDADGNGRLEGQENHDMHFGLNQIWDEFSSDKNRDLINPILDTWVGSDLDKNVDTLSKAEMTEQAILHSVPYW